MPTMVPHHKASKTSRIELTTLYTENCMSFVRLHNGYHHRQVMNTNGATSYDSSVGLRAKKDEKHNLGNKSCKVLAISISICSILVAALECISEDVKSICRMLTGLSLYARISNC